MTMRNAPNERAETQRFHQKRSRKAQKTGFREWLILCRQRSATVKFFNYSNRLSLDRHRRPTPKEYGRVDALARRRARAPGRRHPNFRIRANRAQ
jgi:hypothetical protein